MSEREILEKSDNKSIKTQEWMIGKVFGVGIILMFIALFIFGSGEFQKFIVYYGPIITGGIPENSSIIIILIFIIPILAGGGIDVSKQIRKKIADSSRRVIKGQIGEQIAPLLSEEMRQFNRSDMRFIGAPIDYLIIDGYTNVKDGDGDEVTIILCDIKTGKAKLTREQKIIKKACENGRIRFLTVKILDDDEN